MNDFLYKSLSHFPAVQRGRLATQQLSMGPIMNNIMIDAAPNESYFVHLLLRAESLSVTRYPHIGDGIPGFGGFMGNVDNYELAARLLFSAVEWTRNIPFFPDLALTDQIALLRLGWKELFVLNAAQCPLPIQVTHLVNQQFNNNNNNSSSDRVVSFLDHVRILQDNLDKFRSIGVDPVEFACLKAIVIFTSGKKCGSILLAYHTL